MNPHNPYTERHKFTTQQHVSLDKHQQMIISALLWHRHVHVSITENSDTEY